MKRFVLACLIASSCQGLVQAATLNLQAAADDGTWQVLQKAAVAARALSYQGIFVCQSGSQSKSVQITHFFNGQGEYARNIVLDGASREVFSQNNDLVIFSPKNQKIVVEKRRGQNMFPAILPTNLDAIKENYTLKPSESERVAGRTAQVLILEPKDTLRYSYKFWIDNEYGLLLKSVMFNKRNEAMESIGFSQLALLTKVDLDWFQPKIDSKKSYVMEEEAAITIAENATNTDWAIKDLPTGYRKVDQMRRVVHGKPLPVTHLIFSDGLATVSLFIEPVAKNVKPKIIHSIVGNTSFYTNTADGYQVTAVGEVPEATVAQIAHSVTFKKP
ncbi:MAG TPA: MucB/RseB C-terminal domain-containing protein [Methylotenera sp.]|nr:MucB/RseB C-terminal domain-containing protein [Methylotenera sp.]